MKLRIKQTKLTLQLIGWLQLVGGIFGLGLIAYLMLRTGTINGAVLLIFCIGVSLFIFSIYCGKSLIWDRDKSFGITVSIINHFIQLVQWTVAGYGITYISGISFAIGIHQSISNFVFDAGIATFKMSINSDDDFFIRINLVALLIIIILIDILKEYREDKLLVQAPFPEEHSVIEEDSI